VLVQSFVLVCANILRDVDLTLGKLVCHVRYTKQTYLRARYGIV